MSSYRRLGRLFGDYFDRERWWVITPLRNVPYPPYPGEGEPRHARIRVDWTALGSWLALVVSLAILAFPLVLLVWLLLW